MTTSQQIKTSRWTVHYPPRELYYLLPKWYCTYEFEQYFVELWIYMLYDYTCCFCTHKSEKGSNSEPLEMAYRSQDPHDMNHVIWVPQRSSYEKDVNLKRSKQLSKAAGLFRDIATKATACKLSWHSNVPNIHWFPTRNKPKSTSKHPCHVKAQIAKKHKHTITHPWIHISPFLSRHLSQYMWMFK